MANYVKFRRGNPAAFQAILNNNKAEDDTLYFIYEENESTSSLYLGSKLIASSTIDGATTLAALKDVLIDSNLDNNDCLIFDVAQNGWVNKPIADILPIFVGTNGESPAVAGLVPATTDTNKNLFLRSDGIWVDIVTSIEETLDLKANINDVYTKEESDNAIEAFIKNYVANLDHLKRKIVVSYDSIDPEEENSDRYVYMVPNDHGSYDEYMVINGIIEKIGDWTVDLKDYAKQSDVNEALSLKANSQDVNEALSLKANINDLNNKVDKEENARLITQAEINKLANVEENFIKDTSEEFIVKDGKLEAVIINQNKVDGLVESLESINNILNSKVNTEENARLITNDEIVKLAAIKDLIQAVNPNNFSIDENGQLLLNQIQANEINGLSDALANKVDKVNGSRLITEVEANKLEKLSIDADGNIGLSGTVSASNVQELYDNVVNIVSGKGNGVYDNIQRPLLNIEHGAEKNIINSVNDLQLSVDTNRKLSIKAIDLNIITGLEDILNNKATVTQVDNVIDLLNSKAQTYESKLAALEGHLTWQPIN